jgi:hypothetical protein
MKNFWLREEITIADELHAAIPDLTKEFLEHHTDFINGNFIDSRTWTDPSWRVTGVKYDNPYNGHYQNKIEEVKAKYPTAVKLTEKFNQHCGVSTYSSIEPQSIIARHIDQENKANLFVSIHVPLIVPSGDLFLESEGVEIDWSDIFALDNQLIHSVHNYTNQRRLVYIINLTRKFLGLEDGIVYDADRGVNTPEFVRGALPKFLHKNQH